MTDRIAEYFTKLSKALSKGLSGKTQSSTSTELDALWIAMDQEERDYVERHWKEEIEFSDLGAR